MFVMLPRIDNITDIVQQCRVLQPFTRRTRAEDVRIDRPVPYQKAVEHERQPGHLSGVSGMPFTLPAEGQHSLSAGRHTGHIVRARVEAIVPAHTADDTRRSAEVRNARFSFGQAFRKSFHAMSRSAAQRSRSQRSVSPSMASGNSDA